MLTHVEFSRTMATGLSSGRILVVDDDPFEPLCCCASFSAPLLCTKHLERTWPKDPVKMRLDNSRRLPPLNAIRALRPRPARVASGPLAPSSMFCRCGWAAGKGAGRTAWSRALQTAATGVVITEAGRRYLGLASKTCSTNSPRPQPSAAARNVISVDRQLGRHSSRARSFPSWPPPRSRHRDLNVVC